MLFLILFIPLVSSGSDPDSLLSIWQSNMSSDEEKFQAIHALITDYYLAGDPDSALILSEMQLGLARESGNRFVEMQALLSKGRAYYYKSSYNESLSFLQRSLELSMELDDRDNRPEIYRMIGIVFEAQGTLKRAWNTIY